MKGCVVVLANGQEFDFFEGKFTINRTANELEVWQDNSVTAVWRMDAIAGVYYYKGI